MDENHTVLKTRRLGNVDPTVTRTGNAIHIEWVPTNDGSLSISSYIILRDDSENIGSYQDLCRSDGDGGDVERINGDMSTTLYCDTTMTEFEPRGYAVNEIVRFYV